MGQECNVISAGHYFIEYIARLLLAPKAREC